MIQSVNDRKEDALRLAKILSGIKAKINLIPLNPHQGLDMSPPTEERMLAFQEILIDRQFTAMIRKSKGRDIGAACGQLAGKAGPTEGGVSLPLVPRPSHDRRCLPYLCGCPRLPKAQERSGSTL